MGSFTPDLHSKRREFVELWDVHRNADWPEAVGSHEGELMTLETVIGGCVTFFIEEENLDPPRVAMLRDCLNELDDLLCDIESEAKPYFERLRAVGDLLRELG